MTRFKVRAVALVATTVAILGASADAARADADDGPIVSVPAVAPTAPVGVIILDRDTGWDCPGC
jgi:hypothetical protein